MLSKSTPNKQVKRDLKESLLHEGGGFAEVELEHGRKSLTRNELSQQVQKLMHDGDDRIQGLDVFPPTSRKMFEDMVKRHNTPTDGKVIVSAVLTQDSKWALFIVQDQRTPEKGKRVSVGDDQLLQGIK